jgi:leader peptidase (prepilin peptidase) / N-methyltransferase
MDNQYVLYLAVTLLSLAVGSLLNVVIYRLPIMLESEWKEQCCELLHVPHEPVKSINLFLPRSFCPHCKTQIYAYQNIPLLSYLFLKGKCATCKSPISLRYPFIELLTMLLSIVALWQVGLTVKLPFLLVGLWLLICLFFIDLEHQILPDCLTYLFLWTGLMANILGLFAPLSTAVLSCAGGYLFLWGFVKIFYWVTGKIGMGHGDFKLFAAFGAWLGWMTLPLILLFSSVIGAIIGGVYLYKTKQSKNTTIPFGPFLCVSGFIALFWGSNIIQWYLRLWMS